VQAGDDLILKRMKRRHLRAHTIDFCNRIRRLRPEIAFGADLIAGFPTETSEMFERTASLIDEAGFSYVHVFPFSVRKGTPAARMRQVPHATIKERARVLRTKGQAALSARLKRLIGSEQEILVEKPGVGRTPCFATVAFEDRGFVAGDLVSVRIANSDERNLHGRVLKTAANEATPAIA
jgi:threonylcarbamoyladenosine tRNA methylthiotransferase MtaB